MWVTIKRNETEAPRLTLQKRDTHDDGLLTGLLGAGEGDGEGEGAGAGTLLFAGVEGGGEDWGGTEEGEEDEGLPPFPPLP